MQPRTRTPRQTARPTWRGDAPDVLVLGQDPAALQELSARVRSVLPGARVVTLASTTELVFALARQDTSIVIIDSAHFDEAPPSLLKLSHGNAPALQLALIGASDTGPHAVPIDALADWLRRACSRALPPTLPPVKVAAAAFTVQPHAADAALGAL